MAAAHHVRGVMATVVREASFTGLSEASSASDGGAPAEHRHGGSQRQLALSMLNFASEGAGGGAAPQPQPPSDSGELPVLPAEQAAAAAAAAPALQSMGSDSPRTLDPSWTVDALDHTPSRRGPRHLAKPLPIGGSAAADLVWRRAKERRLAAAAGGDGGLPQQGSSVSDLARAAEAAAAAASTPRSAGGDLSARSTGYGDLTPRVSDAAGLGGANGGTPGAAGGGAGEVSHGGVRNLVSVFNSPGREGPATNGGAAEQEQRQQVAAAAAVAYSSARMLFADSPSVSRESSLNGAVPGFPIAGPSTAAPPLSPAAPSVLQPGAPAIPGAAPSTPAPSMFYGAARRSSADSAAQEPAAKAAANAAAKAVAKAAPAAVAATAAAAAAAVVAVEDTPESSAAALEEPAFPEPGAPGEQTPAAAAPKSASEPSEGDAAAVSSTAAAERQGEEASPSLTLATDRIAAVRAHWKTLTSVAPDAAAAASPAAVAAAAATPRLPHRRASVMVEAPDAAAVGLVRRLVEEVFRDPNGELTLRQKYSRPPSRTGVHAGQLATAVAAVVPGPQTRAAYGLLSAVWDLAMLPARLAVRGLLLTHEQLGPGRSLLLAAASPILAPVAAASAVLLAAPAALCMPLLAPLVGALALAVHTLRSIVPSSRAPVEKLHAS
jgi:hypothetical protein